MFSKFTKSLLILAFSIFLLSITNVSVVYAEDKISQNASEKKPESEGKFDPAKLIMEHIMDAHEFHFATIGEKQIAITLPVLLYSKERGFAMFSFSRLGEGTIYNGYKSIDGKIVAVDAVGNVDQSVSMLFDFSLTRNVVQMLLALTLLVVLMLNVAKKYIDGGSKKAPSGFQGLIEPVITFVRDEVGKPNLGAKYEKFMPYLLTIFFFILINNIIGLIPGTANVTGNIAFTLVLAVISLLVILFSTNIHFWGHIFWPPGVPFLVKVILIPVELLGVFIKPAALMIRLFANMVAGHIVITCFILLIFIFGAMSHVAGWGFAPVSVLFTVFIYLIEVLVAFIQAFIFTNLTAVFIGQAMEAPHNEEAGHH